MSLYLETHGGGPPLVLVHGWGLHGGIFAPLIATLARSFRVVVPDLPGFGFSRRDVPSPAAVEDVAKCIADAVGSPAAWLGWSLGGLVALQAARAGAADRLILISATPKFVQATDWPHGLAPEVFAQFARDLALDYRATLTRFLSLQVGAGERETLRALREAMLARGEPAMAALRAGLHFLRDTDARDILAEVAVPAQIVHGARDRLVPAGAARHLAAHLPRARLHVIENAGHAPFLSHTDACLAAIGGFLCE